MNADRFTLDTNILIYSIDASAGFRHVVAGRASRWDGLLIATAAEAGCSTILTEDMPDGTVLSGVRIVNPFAGDGLSEAAARVLTASVGSA